MSQKPRLNTDSGILNEQVLYLVFESLKWNIHTLCYTALVNRKLHALTQRLLWRELCVFRASRLVATITENEPNGRVLGGWHALAKLLFFCGGCESSRHFVLSHDSPGHFLNWTRFSKTSGKSFLAKKCRGDVLYVSDPCEHSLEKRKGDEVGIFKGFMKSRTREILIMRRVEFEESVKCPYCGARVWSMTAARLIARKSAARRLGSSDDALEYFVCLNGHLHGACWLVSLSSDDEESDYLEEEEEEDEDNEVDLDNEVYLDEDEDEEEEEERTKLLVLDNRISICSNGHV